MKLIDLLVKELPQRGGWPDGAVCATQDGDGGVYFSEGATPEFGFVAWHDGDWCGNEFHTITATDYDTAIITRAQYEAAIAKNDGWIECDCPVDSGAIVEVKYRNHSPLHFNNDRAGDFDWAHTGSNADIIAYRLHGHDINSRTKDDRLEQDLNECIGQDVAPAWDGDGLPPVGADCEIYNRSEWVAVKIKFIGDKWIVAEPLEGMNEDCCENQLHGEDCYSIADKPHAFRPLRTEAEKEREIGVSEMLKLMYGPQEYNYREICEIIYDAGYRKENK